MDFSQQPSQPQAIEDEVPKSKEPFNEGRPGVRRESLSSRGCCRSGAARSLAAMLWTGCSFHR
jgi:hypothetical protein